MKHHKPETRYCTVNYATGKAVGGAAEMMVRCRCGIDVGAYVLDGSDPFPTVKRLIDIHLSQSG